MMNSYQTFIILSAIKQELQPDEFPDRSEVTKFDQKKLKHVETQEKNPVPTKEGNLIEDLLA